VTDIAHLHDEHRELLDLLGQLSNAIARPEPPPQAQLFDLRMKICGTLIGHLKTEDWTIYPMLAAHPDAAVAAKARRFSDEMGGLASAFADYSRRWTTLTIESNWSGFRSETAEIIKALRQRIEREEAELYPLAMAAASAKAA
jgi:hemerythrin-like domain-containing protein